MILGFTATGRPVKIQDVKNNFFVFSEIKFFTPEGSDVAAVFCELLYNTGPGIKSGPKNWDNFSAPYRVKLFSSINLK